MTVTIIHQCECPTCQQAEEHPDKIHHHHMNLFFSRLNEQQKRWYAAIEAEKAGWGGQTLIAQITGLSVPTIQRGRQELSDDLANRPRDGVRIAGGGRKAAEKKSR